MKIKQKIISKAAALKLYDLSHYPFMNQSLVDMEGEEWIDIPNLDGYYLISNYSRVKALSRPLQVLRKGHLITYYTKERIIPQSLRGIYNEHIKKYFFCLQISWTYEKRLYRYLVHRLMYECYIGDIDFETDELRITHKDGDNLNNVIENLESSNGTSIFYKSLKNQRRPQKPKKLDKTHNQIGVLQFDLQGNLIQHFPSVTEAAKAFNTKVISLKTVLTNQLKQYKGFVFRYETDTYNGEYANFSKSKKVSQYAVNGKLIKIYDSVVHAFQETGIDRDSISKSALFKQKFAGSFVWRYENDIYEGDYTHKKRNLPVCQYHLDGRFIKEFTNSVAAAKSIDFTVGAITACINGACRTTGGFVWRYKDQPYHGEYLNVARNKSSEPHKAGIGINQLDLQGNLIANFSSIKAASDAVGIPKSTLQHRVNSDYKIVKGFLWEIAPQAEKVITPQKGIKGNPIKVCQYTKDGEKIASFNSVLEASIMTGIKEGIIRYFFKRPFHVSGDYIWRKEGDEYQGELKGIVRENERKNVTQYDLSGNKLKVYPSSYAAMKTMKTSHSSIGSALNGKLRSACGFIWRYGDGPDKIVVEKIAYPRSKTISCYDFEGNKKGVYGSIGEAARINNHSYLGISLAVNGKAKSSCELVWIYGDGPDKIDIECHFLKGEVKAKSKNVVEKI